MIRPLRTTLAALALLLVAHPAAAQQAPASDASPDALAARAAELLARGERSWGEDRERAESLLREGVETLQAAQGAGDVRSAELDRTLGAAHLLLGEQGRAVLHLRRAQRLDPTDPAIRETLGAARARVGAAPQPDVSERAARTLLLWRGYVPRTALLVTGAAAWLLGWALLLAKRLGAPRPTGRLGLAAIVLALVPAGALASEQVIIEMREHAVVVRQGAVAHNGPSADLYPPTFTDPVEPGLEVVITDRRDGWARVRLASGQETWLPEPALEPVTPPRPTR